MLPAARGDVWVTLPRLTLQTQRHFPPAQPQKYLSDTDANFPKNHLLLSMALRARADLQKHHSCCLHTAWEAPSPLTLVPGGGDGVGELQTLIWGVKTDPDGRDEHLIIPLPAQHHVFQVFGGSMWTLRKRNKLLETTHGWDLLTQQVLATTRQRALRKAKTLAKKKPFEGRLSEESFQVTADAFSISFSPLSQPGSSGSTGRLGRLPVFTSP